MGMTTLDRRHVSTTSIRLADPTADAERVRSTLTAWFRSPFWIDSAVADVISEADAPTDDAAATANLQESALSRAIATVGSADAEGLPVSLALVDRYLVGQRGELSLQHYRSVAAALRNDHPTAVRMEVVSGGYVACSLAAYLAWMVSQSVVAGFGRYVTYGLASSLAHFDVAEGDTPIAGLACILPVPAGLQQRAALLEFDQVAASLPLYPVLGMLLPELSPRIVPTTLGIDTSILGEDLRGHVVPLSAWEFRAEKLRRVMSHTPRSTAATATGHAIYRIHRAKNALRDTGLVQLMMSRGLDYDSSRGLVRRLRIQHHSTPWISGISGRLLDEACMVLPGPSA